MAINNGLHIFHMASNCWINTEYNIHYKYRKIAEIMANRKRHNVNECTTNFLYNHCL